MSGWKKYPDEKPKKSGCYFVTDGTLWQGHLSVDAGYYYAHEDRWCSSLIENVRYWMEIPELPKEENETQEESNA
jgi:hypothetical protein